MAKKKNVSKRKPDQANKVNNELGRRTAQIDNTYNEAFTNYLSSSEDEVAFRADDSKKIRPKKMHYRIWDWVKKNLIATLIGAAVTAIIGFVVSNVVTLKIEYKVIEVKISEMEKDISSIEEDYISKQLLEMQIASLKDSLEGRSDLDMKEIENQISLIRQQLDFLKEDIENSKEDK